MIFSELRRAQIYFWVRFKIPENQNKSASKTDVSAELPTSFSIKRPNRKIQRQDLHRQRGKTSTKPDFWKFVREKAKLATLSQRISACPVSTTKRSVNSGFCKSDSSLSLYQNSCMIAHFRLETWTAILLWIWWWAAKKRAVPFQSLWKGVQVSTRNVVTFVLWIRVCRLTFFLTFASCKLCFLPIRSVSCPETKIPGWNLKVKFTSSKVIDAAPHGIQRSLSYKDKERTELRVNFTIR